MTLTRGFDNIRSIEPATHTDFEDGNLHSLTREVGKGDRRHHLEKAGMPGQRFPRYQAIGH